MATTITKKVGATNSPTTMDYSTLQAFEDAVTANLVVADEAWVADCYDQGSFTALVDISGHTTSATQNITFQCNLSSTAGFGQKSGVRSTALFYNASGGVTLEGTSCRFDNSTNYTVIDGFQVKVTGGYYKTIYSSSALNFTVKNCILDGGNGSNYNVTIDAATGVLVNCLIYQRDDNSAVLTRGLIENCTLIRDGLPGTGTAITSNYNLALIKNCAVFGFATFVSGSAVAGSGYNATDLASAPGSNNQTSLTTSNQVVNTASDYRAKSGGALESNGTPDSTNAPLDISYYTRHASTPTIGAWEQTAAGGGGGANHKPLTLLGAG